MQRCRNIALWVLLRTLSAMFFLNHLVVLASSAAAWMKADSDTWLANKIAELLSSPQLRSTRFGIMVYSLDRDTTLVEYGSREQLTPASLTKLYYTAAAYATMGPDYRIRTVIATDGILRDGTLEGNLYVVGHGDCLLTTRDLEALVDRLQALGIRRIRGSIIADATYFDPVTDRQQYSGDPERMENLPPITALGIEGNKLTVIVTRGGGRRIRVQTLPTSAAVSTHWSNASFTPRQAPPPLRKRTQRQRYGDKVLFHQHSHMRGKGRTIQPVRISSSMRVDGIQEIQVVGIPQPNSSVSFSVIMLDPPLVAAGAFKRCLEASGITVEGTVRHGSMPPAARELTAWERPLQDFVKLCNKNSDNFIAEHVMKIVGAHCCGNVQCNIHAYRTVAMLLDSLGVGSSSCLLFDGSGLSRKNKVTVASLIGLLKYCAQQPWSNAFFSTLAIAGEDGTLAKRMRQQTLRGNLFAKTGTHRNVSGLAGIARASNGERFLFAALWNGNSVGLYKQLENQLGELLVSYGSVEKPATDSAPLDR